MKRGPGASGDLPGWYFPENKRVRLGLGQGSGRRGYVPALRRSSMARFFSRALTRMCSAGNRSNQAMTEDATARPESMLLAYSSQIGVVAGRPHGS